MELGYWKPSNEYGKEELKYDNGQPTYGEEAISYCKP